MSTAREPRAATTIPSATNTASTEAETLGGNNNVHDALRRSGNFADQVALLQPDELGRRRAVSPKGGGGELGAGLSLRGRPDEGRQTELDGGLGFSDGKLSLEGGNSRLDERQRGLDGKGPTSKESLGHTLAYSNEEGLTAGMTHGKSTSDGAGNSQGRSTSGSFNTKEGIVGLEQSFSRESADGQKEKTKIGGSLDLREDGALEGGELKASGNRGPMTFDLGGGYAVKIEKPGATGPGKFTVNYTITLKGKVGVGAQGGSESASSGVSGGGSLSYAGEAVTSGTRVFATYAEAYRFWQHGDGVDDLRRVIGEGEKRTTSTKNELGLKGEANLEGVKLGVGGKYGSSERVTEEGGPDKTIVVEVAAEEVYSASGDMGNLLSMSYGLSRTDKKAVRVRFDLKTPEGEAGYKAFLAGNRKLPAKGWTLIGTVTGRSDARTKGIGALGAKAGETQSVETEETRDGDGKVTGKKATGTQATDASLPLTELPFIPEGYGKFKESTSLTGEDGPDGKRWNSESKVETTDASDASHALNKATGGYVDRDRAKGDASSTGKWSVSTNFTPAQIDRFVARILAGDFNRHFAKHKAAEFDAGPILELQKALRATTDEDARRKLVVTYVSQGGRSALDQIERLGGGEVDAMIALEGDLYLLGAAGIAKWDAEQQALDQRSRGGGNMYQLSSEIQVAMAYHIKRRAALANLDHYPELPKPTRDKESQRSQSYINRLDNILKVVKQNMATGPTKKEEAKRASLPEEHNQSKMPGPEELAQKQLEVAVGQMNMQRALCKKRADLAEYHRRMHNGAYAAKSARKDLGGEGVLGTSFLRGKEFAAYQEAEAAQSAGLRGQEQAAGMAAEQALTKSAEDMVARAGQSSAAFVDARNHFDRAIAIYEQVRQRNAGAGFDGYNRELAPS